MAPPGPNRGSRSFQSPFGFFYGLYTCLALLTLLFCSFDFLCSALGLTQLAFTFQLLGFSFLCCEFGLPCSFTFCGTLACLAFSFLGGLFSRFAFQTFSL
jgi:hypothetical protein